MESMVIEDKSATVGGTRTKVLCFAPHLGGGGAEMHLVRLLNHFDREEFEPVLAVARSGGSYEARLPQDLVLHECGWRLPSSTLRMQSAIPRLRRVLQREQPDVVIAFVDHAVAAAAKALEGRADKSGCAARSAPLFIAGLQNNLEKTLQHLPRWTQGWLRRQIIAAYAGADHVVSLSAGAAETLVQLVPAAQSRVSVIHNAGYDREVEKLALEKPSSPPPKPPWFLSCGRLTAQKDFCTLLHAFARIKDEMEGELWILGEGGLRNHLKRQIAKLGLAGRVRLPGFVENPFAFMARATTFVLSSRWEGFGNVLTEAMVCGTPIISTDCPHGPREILENGRWGELVPVGDIAALAAAMRASEQERERFVARAQMARRHATAFEASRIAKEYEGMIRSVLSSKRKRLSHESKNIFGASLQENA